MAARWCGGGRRARSRRRRCRRADAARPCRRRRCRSPTARRPARRARPGRPSPATGCSAGARAGRLLEQRLAVQPASARGGAPVTGRRAPCRARASAAPRSAGSGSASTSRTRTPGCVARSASIAGSEQLQARRLERADAHDAGHCARRGRREVGLGALHAGEQRSACSTSTSAASVSRTRRPARSSSGAPASRSSTRELLGDGRRAVGRAPRRPRRPSRGVAARAAGGGGAGRASFDIIARSSAELPLIPMDCAAHHRMHATEPSSSSPRPRRSASLGDLRQARVRRRARASRRSLFVRFAIAAPVLSLVLRRHAAAGRGCGACRGAWCCRRSALGAVGYACSPACTSSPSSGSTPRSSRCSSTATPRS